MSSSKRFYGKIIFNDENENEKKEEKKEENK